MPIQSLEKHKSEISENGFTVINQVFSDFQVENMLKIIDGTDSDKPAFRKTNDLFAIRQILKEIPALRDKIFTDHLKKLIRDLFGDEYFVVKSIYFDKPGSSNWFVSYHQDLTISVDKKHNIEGFGPWTVKQDQFAVQPPVNILQSNFTIRIHLDNTDENNGALRVIPGSHNKGVLRSGNLIHEKGNEVCCRVPKGSIMIMKPLLLHASGRSLNDNKRRVIHIEFSNQQLHSPLNWSELDYSNSFHKKGSTS